MNRSRYRDHHAGLAVALAKRLNFSLKLFGDFFICS